MNEIISNNNYELPKKLPEKRIGCTKIRSWASIDGRRSDLNKNLVEKISEKNKSFNLMNQSLDDSQPIKAKVVRLKKSSSNLVLGEKIKDKVQNLKNISHFENENLDGNSLTNDSKVKTQYNKNKILKINESLNRTSPSLLSNKLFTSKFGINHSLLLPNLKKVDNENSFRSGLSRTQSVFVH